MATTGRDLVTTALKRLGVLAVGETPTADDLTDGLRELNLLAASWNVEAPYWNLPTFDADTDLWLDDGVEPALIADLSMALAPSYTRPVTPEMRERRDVAKATIKRSRQGAMALAYDPALSPKTIGRFDVETGQ